MHNPFKARSVQISILTLASAFVAGEALGLLKARLVPELLDVNPWWWAFVLVVFLIRPLTRFFRKT